MKKLIVPIVVAVLVTFAVFGITRYVACLGRESSLDSLQDVTALTKTLNLTEEQAREVRALHANLRDKLSDCCARHCAARAGLAKALAGGTNETAQADELMAEMSQAYQDGEKATLENVMQVRRVLNLEQRKRFDGMITDSMCRTCSVKDSCK